jgi:hypothetical protein
LSGYEQLGDRGVVLAELTYVITERASVDDLRRQPDWEWHGFTPDIGLLRSVLNGDDPPRM